MIVGFASQAPSFFWAPLASVLVDRWNRHRMLVLTHSLFMVQSRLLALVGFAHSQVVWLSALMLILIGFGMMVPLAACNTILQTIVEERRRGRVMGCYEMAFLGMSPIDSLFVGVLAGPVGVVTTVTAGSLACAEASRPPKD